MRRFFRSVADSFREQLWAALLVAAGCVLGAIYSGSGAESFLSGLVWGATIASVAGWWRHFGIERRAKLRAEADAERERARNEKTAARDASKLARELASDSSGDTA